ncbi:uncharacterized protein EI90DRAFT_3257236, partial [Cantharellus anzutake]|uniref:uncharacterized protein n=1 Tax=Cantharellus anzutake TaxID=1750568 RepID=UPI0019083865
MEFWEDIHRRHVMPLYRHTHLRNRDQAAKQGSISDGDDQDREGVRLSLASLKPHEIKCTHSSLADLTQDLDHSAKKVKYDTSIAHADILIQVRMDVNANLTPAGNDEVVNLHGSDLSDEDEIAELRARFNELGDYLIEAGETILQQVEKDEGVWMRGMAGHDLTRKAGPIVE